MEKKSRKVSTQIEIFATPDQVWSVLTDWEKLKEWSSTFIGISTDQMTKDVFFISYFKNPMGGKPIELSHVCTDFEEGKKFGWSGKIVGQIKDHHTYAVEPLAQGTTLFKQEDGLQGPYSKLAHFFARPIMLALYRKFNKELKERVEHLYPKE